MFKRISPQTRSVSFNLRYVVEKIVMSFDQGSVWGTCGVSLQILRGVCRITMGHLRDTYRDIHGVTVGTP
jgi:hypothetical protein